MPLSFLVNLTNQTPPFALAKGLFALNAPRLKQGIGANGVLIPVAGAKTISTAFAVLMVFVFSTNRTPPFALAKGQFALNAPQLKQGIGANGVLIPVAA